TPLSMKSTSSGVRTGASCDSSTQKTLHPPGTTVRPRVTLRHMARERGVLSGAALVGGAVMLLAAALFAPVASGASCKATRFPPPSGPSGRARDTRPAAARAAERAAPRPRGAARRPPPLGAGRGGGAAAGRTGVFVRRAAPLLRDMSPKSPRPRRERHPSPPR